MEQESIINLKLNETLQMDSLKIILKDIIYEEIDLEPFHDENSAYPEGSGVSISLDLIDGDKHKRMYLELLSPPYKGTNDQHWGQIYFCLVDVSNDDTVQLKISKKMRKN